MFKFLHKTLSLKFETITNHMLFVDKKKTTNRCGIEKCIKNSNIVETE